MGEVTAQLRSMAKACGLSAATISRIWRAFGLKPHRCETFKLSRDPLFIEKVRDIVGLYLHPPERAVVLCVDGFISLGSVAPIQGALGALLIHGATRYPEGHGAIERFHRTTYDQVLRSLDGAADMDPACEALTLRLRHFLDRYNDTPHETLGKDTTPRQRWEQGRPLRFPADQDDRTAGSLKSASMLFCTGIRTIDAVRGPGLPQSILAQHRAIAIPPPMPETLSGTWPPPTEVHSQTPIPRA